MAEIAPFRALRYASPDLAPLVSPPYDVLSRAERDAFAARSPHNVVHVNLPDGDGDAKYARAAELLAAWRRDGVVVRDDAPAYYRYAQTFAPPGGGPRRTRTGFLGAVRLVPFSARIVLPHERTLAGPKENRLKLLRATRACLSPGFLLYRDPSRALDAALATARPLAAFATDDGIEHALSHIDDPAALAAITAHVASSALLVADGHHRYETALAYSEEVDAAVRASGGHAPARAAHRYNLVFFCNEDDPELLVLPTHRLVHSLPAFDADRFLAAAATLFDARELPGGSATALADEVRRSRSRAPSLGVLLAGRQPVVLALRGDADLAAHPTLGALPAPLRRTEVALLHSGLLEHVLGITREAQAAKTNLAYAQDPAEVAGRVARGEGQAGFVLPATPVSDVRAVAEAGDVMPQKSTFFYPKVATGLAFHELDPTREA